MKRLLFLFLVFLFASNDINAQFEFKKTEELEKVKSGTTYVLMNDVDSLNCEDYVNLYKKYWTLGKIEFIKSSQLDSYLTPENSFISIEEVEKLVSDSRLRGGKFEQHTSYYISVNYLCMWVLGKSYFERKKEKLKNKDKIYVVSMDLKTPIIDENRFPTDCVNKINESKTGIGFLKNYIQQLMTSLNPDTSLTTNGGNKKALKDLKNETLYVDEGVLKSIKKEKDVFKQYKYKYQLISLKDINDKIINDTVPFFYLKSTVSESGRYTSITNSQTGEVVYGDLDDAAFDYNKYLKEDDMMYIYKRVGP